jgi:hypothetical protein
MRVAAYEASTDARGATVAMATITAARDPPRDRQSSDLLAAVSQEVHDEVAG